MAKREPSYCRHKATNQAYINLGGKVHYLGEYGTEKSKERYNALKSEWLVNRHDSRFQPTATLDSGPTVADVCNAFLDHAEGYYQNSGELYQYQLAIRPLAELYSFLPAVKFGVVEFQAVRNQWLSNPINNKAKGGGKKKDTEGEDQLPPKQRSRQYINKSMKRILRLFKWAAGQGMVPVTVHQTLKCVDPLKRGRTQAREAEPVSVVDPKLVTATLRHLTPVLRDMVQFQLLVGCRPGELVKITPAMVDRSSKVWRITLSDHKTAYRGLSRTLYVGPQAQQILKPYLLRDENAACFSPQESEKQRLALKHEARKTPLNSGNRPGTNKLARKPRRAPGTSFTTGSYSKSILYACKRGQLEVWSPNQLRHNAATKIRKRFGIEAASVILGHSGLEVTQIYAEKDEEKAIEIAMLVG